MVQQSKKGSGMKRIIIYFSLEGNTEYIADELAKVLPADKLKLVPGDKIYFVNKIKTCSKESVFDQWILKVFLGWEECCYGRKARA